MYFILFIIHNLTYFPIIFVDGSTHRASRTIVTTTSSFNDINVIKRMVFGSQSAGFAHEFDVTPDPKYVS